MVQIHYLSDVFGLLSSRNYSTMATMATWCNDFFLFALLSAAKFSTEFKVQAW